MVCANYESSRRTNQWLCMENKFNFAEIYAEIVKMNLKTLNSKNLNSWGIEPSSRLHNKNV